MTNEGDEPTAATETGRLRRSRDDLIQVEYELNSLLIRDVRKRDLSDGSLQAAAFLGTDTDDVFEASEEFHASDIDAVSLALASQLRPMELRTIRGATPSEPATWKYVDLGDSRIRVPSYVSIPFPVGAVADVPLYVRAWPKDGGMTLYVEVSARRDDMEAAEAYLSDLIASTRGARSPYYRRVVEVSASHGGPAFRVVKLEPTRREDLVLSDEVWQAVGRNIDRMFGRMARLQAAGPGTNRGLVLAGPPGTGKSALCRVLAAEYEGRATVTIMSASAGEYMLGQVYERLNDLAPALVLIEDLDLLVGDREAHERSPLVGFLTVLDGLMTRHSGVVTVASTNDARLIDDAALRAARFDQVVTLSLPDVSQRERILALYLASLEHTADLRLLAQATNSFSGADLREVVRSAVLDSACDVITQEELAASVSRRRGVVERDAVGFGIR